ncbi:MAG: CRISPR-associated helicase/endonuclease Cas3, partial [Syntrophobacterales bacterium CG_4_8_14_3_um_filter_49_14]
DGVYSDEAQVKIPDSLLGLSWNAEGDAGSKRGMARLNALKLDKGYTRSSAEDSGGWDKETRIPTRLGDESTLVALARLEGGFLKPYAQASEFAWELSMIALPKQAWIKAQESIPDSLRGSIDKLKEGVKLLKWIELLPLTEDLEHYYDPQMGWGLKKEERNESD